MTYQCLYGRPRGGRRPYPSLRPATVIKVTSDQWREKVVKPLRNIRHRGVSERRGACLVSSCLFVWYDGTVGMEERSYIPAVLALSFLFCLEGRAGVLSGPVQFMHGQREVEERKGKQGKIDVSSGNKRIQRQTDLPPVDSRSQPNGQLTRAIKNIVTPPTKPNTQPTPPIKST